MSERAPVTFSTDADGVGWIVFDDSESRANVFNAATLTAFASALLAAERARVRALVIASANEKIFIAGADLRTIATLPDSAMAMEFSHTGQKLFQRVAEFSAPVVCAVHGACAGGGFELALACHWRIASDSPATRIGLPETGIGTIPGWGGSVRLPRLIGVKPALDHILKAQLVSAADALQAGLIHEIAPVGELRARAKAAALKLVAEGRPVSPSPPALVPDTFRELRETVWAKTRGTQPALLAAIDVVECTAGLSIPEALEVEARIFGEVTTGEVCKNLIHVFFLREAAKKRTLEPWFEKALGSRERSGLRPDVTPIRRVGVVGAGVMGTGIAQSLAVQGFEVVMRDLQPELVSRGVAVIRGLFDAAVKRGKLAAGEANSALHRIATTTSWEGFETCDLVIEAIVENVEAKRALFSELAAIVRGDALLASNTSALPIEEIAGHVPNPARTLGIHFFNPVSRMTLVELVLSTPTSAESAERALGLVKALGKSPVVCRSSPGFLVTRVLFFYLNEAVRLWEHGVATSAIDAAMREFGWPMGPLRLIDEVGVDVTDFIFDEMANYFPARFTRTKACGAMLAAGLKGRKNGASRGFYRYDGGAERVNDVETLPLLASRITSGRKQTVIADQLMRVMVEEAERCLAEGVVKSADEVDFALLSGAGFPPFRGGLLRWAKANLLRRN